MDLYEALYTTRAMRRVRSDPIPDAVIACILDAAVRAPSGSNAQNWRMIVVDDPEVRAQLGPIYREAYRLLNEVVYEGRRGAAEQRGDEATMRVMRSSDWLAENFEQVPLWVLFFSRNDPSGASIYPAAWNAMLAARGQGVGSCLTTILGFLQPDPVFALLDVPTDKGWQLSAAVSFGYPTGRWGVAERRPVEEVSFSNRWGESLGVEVGGPLWP
ncbi:MAG TPA: nitroreductase family protein [Acidimicrobiia bacterium]|jgi:nitroreductase|nr:nitroreductase family protein [Acidimicrobiia bacterium]